jgi:UDP-4-amino-4-deoxy-L-arabinose formyltransferase/UDP-glucuronic acid dehydrogenase (UDP-4-keto-hexauronic acid decarboxylating)
MKIYVLNTLGIGLDTISQVSKQIDIRGIIGLSLREKSDTISDYIYQADFCKSQGINFMEVESYNLSKESDKRKLLELEIDVLIVSGWQRLIPEWLINHCSICAIGSHGSPLGITKGRGRSPQNWALILGLNTFFISIFKINSGIDSGQIIDTRSFTYSDFDDIKTSYYKVCLLTAEMIVKTLKDPDFIEQKFEEQNDNEAEYLPQRMPEDGRIDWERSNTQIRNFVRALTRPYPGAESYISDCRIKIWSVVPFDINIMHNYKTGEIVKIFNKKDILVRSKDSFLLIIDYEFVSENIELKEGMVFKSESFSQQIDGIIKRHQSKYPELAVSKQIISERNSILDS